MVMCCEKSRMLVCPASWSVPGIPMVGGPCTQAMGLRHRFSRTADCLMQQPTASIRHGAYFLFSCILLQPCTRNQPRPIPCATIIPSHPNQHMDSGR